MRSPSLQPRARRAALSEAPALSRLRLCRVAQEATRQRTSPPGVHLRTAVASASVHHASMPEGAAKCAGAQREAE